MWSQQTELHGIKECGVALGLAKKMSAAFIHLMKTEDSGLRQISHTSLKILEILE